MDSQESSELPWGRTQTFLFLPENIVKMFLCNIGPLTVWRKGQRKTTPGHIPPCQEGSSSRPFQ